MQNLELLLYSSNTNMARVQFSALRRSLQTQTLKWLFAVSFVLVQTQLTEPLSCYSWLRWQRQSQVFLLWCAQTMSFHCVFFSSKGRWPEKRCHLLGNEVWAMNAVKSSEVHNGPQDRRCPGQLQRATQLRGDKERTNHVLKKHIQSRESKNGEPFLSISNPLLFSDLSPSISYLTHTLFVSFLYNQCEFSPWKPK